MKNKKASSLVAVLISASVVGTAFLGSGSASVSADATTQAGLRFLSRWSSGSGIGGAEISAFDPASQRLFVTNGKTNQIDIVDISQPLRPKKVRSIDLAAKGATGVQSVATKNGIVAIAAAATIRPTARYFSPTQAENFSRVRRRVSKSAHCPTTSLSRPTVAT